MIRTAIAVLDLAAEGVKVATRHGLVEQVERDGVVMPAKYTGAKDVQNVASDLKGTFVYWRLTSPITSTTVPGFTLKPQQQVAFTLRMVACVDRSGPCEDASAVMAGVQNNVQTNAPALRTALDALNATIDSVTVDLDSASVYGTELRGSNTRLPMDRQMVAMDVRVTVRAKAGCLPSCVDQVTVNLGGVIIHNNRCDCSGGGSSEDVTTERMASDFTTASTSFVDVTGASVSVEANSTYDVQLFGEWTSNNNDGRCNVSFMAPSGATITAIRQAGSATSFVTNYSISGNDTGSDTASVSTANTRCALTAHGKLITGGTAGSLKLRLKSNDAGYTAKLYAGLSLRITKVN